jgi:hypothetical protein
MRSTIYRRFGLLTILLGSLPLVAADPAPNRQLGARTEVAPERLDDPQLPTLRDALPRSAGAIVLKGLHASIQVNVDGHGNNFLGDAANEPSIAIDPSDPKRIVIGWRQFDTVQSNFRQAGYAYSDDGGATWNFPGVLQPGQFRSDPVLAADSDGTVFYYSLSTVRSVEMFVSEDGGVSWSAAIPAFGGDKAWIAVDTTRGVGDGHVYAIWNPQFTCCAPGTDFTRSVDGGSSYQGPYGLPVKTKWGTVDVGPDGEVYVVGASLEGASGPPHHWIQRSSSTGEPASAPQFELTQGLSLGGQTVGGDAPNPGGLMGQVWVAVDRSRRTTRRNVYVLASVDPPGPDPLNVQFIRSSDGGKSWSAPTRVHDEPPGTNAWQWFGTMSVAPDGRIDVVWNDTRSDPSGALSEVRYAYSTDAGSSWSEGLVVTPPWNSLVGFPNQNKIGDYYHMLSDRVGAGLAYAATFNGEQDIYFLRVGDCDANGVHDSVDIAGSPRDDCNGNGILDACEEEDPCPGCDETSECDDGLFCNGIEACVDGGCRPGVSVACDDGVACTLDQCSERLSTCVHVSDDSSCDNGLSCDGLESCEPVSGCQPGDPPCSEPQACVEPGAFCCTVQVEICNDRLDNDCDGIRDCADSDCFGMPGCSCDGDGICEAGESCRGCPSDCLGRRRLDGFCCGDGVLQPAEGDGEICDGQP